MNSELLIINIYMYIAKVSMPLPQQDEFGVSRKKEDGSIEKYESQCRFRSKMNSEAKDLNVLALIESLNAASAAR